MLFATLDPTLRNLDAAARRARDPVGHRRLHLRPADYARLGVSRHAGGSGRGRRHPARPRHRARGRRRAERGRVSAILKDLGINPDDSDRIVEVWNKLDLVAPERHDALLASAGRAGGEQPVYPLSALTGQGVPALLDSLETRVTRDRIRLDLDLDPVDGQGLHWLYENTQVLSRGSEADGTLTLSVRVAPAKLEPLRHRFGTRVREDVPRRAAE